MDADEISRRMDQLVATLRAGGSADAAADELGISKKELVLTQFEATPKQKAARKEAVEEGKRITANAAEAAARRRAESAAWEATELEAARREVEPSLSVSQMEVVRELERATGNIFVSGEAGTGKSVVLREFVKRTKKNVVVCAPTGLAAAHVGGVTIHSLFGFPVREDYIDFQPSPPSSVSEVLEKIETIVVDEASMVRADLLDLMSWCLQSVRSDPRPFGGVQIILVGDLLQLPPVVKKESREAIDSKFSSEFFFDAEAGKAGDFRTIELTAVLRQSDPVFVAALRRVRVGMVEHRDIELFNSRVVPSGSRADLPHPVLAPHVATVSRHNLNGLTALPGKSHKFFVEWAPKDDAAAPADPPCERQLELKVGCPVLFIRNDFDLGVSNGTAGEVVKVDDDSVTVKVKHRRIVVERIKWPVSEYFIDPKTKALKLEELGAFHQMPLRLAFALTIHRSQGQTYDRATVDFSGGRPFTVGQGYVSVSRVKDLGGLVLTKPLVSSDFKASLPALNFMSRSSARRETAG